MLLSYRLQTRVRRLIVTIVAAAVTIMMLQVIKQTTMNYQITSEFEISDSTTRSQVSSHNISVSTTTSHLSQAERQDADFLRLIGDDLFEQLKKSVSIPVDHKNLLKFGKDARLYRTLLGKVLNESNTVTSQVQIPPLLAQLEAKLFPWISGGIIHKSSVSILQSFTSRRGIVLTCGNWHYKYALLLVRSLREIFKTSLPIHVYYNGDDDLSKESQHMLLQLTGVTTVDLRNYLDTPSYGIGGWSLKLFAMLYAPFEEIVFLDADVLFFQDPSVLFSTDAYKQTGVVLFRDRTIGTGRKMKGYHYAYNAIERVSEYAKKEGRMLSTKSVHDGESGVVVWNKKRAFVELLVVCALNSDPFVKDLYDAFHGDKESYWIVMEMMQSPYRWGPTGGGALGYKIENKVCGGLYHPDFDLKPLWMNGGIVKNKYHDEGRETMNMTHWLLDVGFDDRWDWETNTTPFCHKETNKVVIGTLDERELHIVEQTYNLWEGVLNDTHS